MKRNLILIAFVLLGYACKKEKIDIPSPPDVQRLINDGWKAYDELNFSLAEARFDSALQYEVENAEALLGKGFSLLQQNDYAGSNDYFSLAITRENAFLYNIYTKEPHPDVEWNYTDSLPFIGTSGYEIIVNAPVYILYVNSAYRKNSEGILDITPYYFYKNRIYVDNADLDDPSLADTLFIFYVGYDTTKNINVSNLAEWAYAGTGFSSLADDKYSDAISYLGALTFYLEKSGTSFSFPHYPNFTENNIMASLAYSYFKDGLYGNSYDVLKIADPAFDSLNTLNPFNADGIKALLFEIQKLMK
jgi:tetratricopeptide (TPR) repeat protein